MKNMNWYVSEFEGFCNRRYDYGIEKLFLEGAIAYFANCRHINNDYITKKWVSEAIDQSYEEFSQQSPTLDAIEFYCNNMGLDFEEFCIKLDELKKSKIIQFLKGEVEYITKEANKGMDD